MPAFAASPTSHAPFVADLQLSDFVSPAEVDAAQASQAAETERGHECSEGKGGQGNEREGERALLDAVQQLWGRAAVSTRPFLAHNGKGRHSHSIRSKRVGKRYPSVVCRRRDKSRAMSTKRRTMPNRPATSAPAVRPRVAMLTRRSRPRSEFRFESRMSSIMSSVWRTFACRQAKASARSSPERALYRR
jgi:hypothetical protein